MSLASNISDLATRVATEINSVRSTTAPRIAGATGRFGGVVTTAQLPTSGQQVGDYYIVTN